MEMTLKQALEDHVYKWQRKNAFQINLFLFTELLNTLDSQEDIASGHVWEAADICLEVLLPAFNRHNSCYS